MIQVSWNVKETFPDRNVSWNFFSMSKVMEMYNKALADFRNLRCETVVCFQEQNFTYVKTQYNFTYFFFIRPKENLIVE